MNKKIAVVTLTWNDWKNTIECLESIFNSSYNYFDVILVDNNSEKHHMDKIFLWADNKINIISTYTPQFFLRCHMDYRYM